MKKLIWWVALVWLAGCARYPATCLPYAYYPTYSYTYFAYPYYAASPLWW